MIILNALDEIYFNKDRQLFASYTCDAISTTPMYAQLKKAYEALLNATANSANLNHNQNCFPVIECRYYDRGGYVVLPCYLIRTNENHDVSHTYNGLNEYEENEFLSQTQDGYVYKEEPIAQFKSWHSEHEERCEWETYKRIMELNYLHILPDGAIVEFIYDQNHLYKENSTKTMFEQIEKARFKYSLEEKVKEKNITIQNNTQCKKV